MTFATKTNHENHLKTQRHRKKTSGITKTPTAKTSSRQLLQATNILEKRYYCAVCDYAAGTQ
jgi:hypothetical protein